MTIKTLLVVGVAVAAASSPNVRTNIRDAALTLLEPDTIATDDRRTREQVCDLADLWSTTDRDGRHATAKILKAIARDAQRGTSDPALRVVLTAVPHAYDAHNSARSRAARSVINHECGPSRG